MNFLQLLQSLLDAPHGPGTPFGNKDLIVLDSLRVVIFVFGVIILGLTPFALAKAPLPGQIARFVSMALFTLSALGTELDHMGDYANWRLVVNTLAVVGGAWGLYSFFVWELSAQIKLIPDPLHMRAEIPPEEKDELSDVPHVGANDEKNGP